MNKALLVGINAYPSPNELNGCINDVTDMAGFLVKSCGFAPGDVRLLVDDRATAANIRERLEWLIKGAKKGDRLLFHYSGHGVSLATRGPDGEPDGMDEAICPIDFNFDIEQTIIRDKEFVRIFSALPQGVQFTWISDSCYSGGMAKTFIQVSDQIKSVKRKLYRLPADIAWRNSAALNRMLKPKGMKGAAQELNLALITGCGENQLSADASFNNRFNGALTYFLLQELKEKKGTETKLNVLVSAVIEELKQDGFNQIPELLGSPTLHGKYFLEA